MHKNFAIAKILLTKKELREKMDSGPVSKQDWAAKSNGTLKMWRGANFSLF